MIEVISIAFRPVSLSLRLFGNIYAGENLMHTMSDLGETMGMPLRVSFLMKVIIPIPFYFLELLVGVVQALVFTLLCAVYIKLTTSHEDGAHGAAHGPRSAHPAMAHADPPTPTTKTDIEQPFARRDHPKRVDGGTKHHQQQPLDKTT